VSRYRLYPTPAQETALLSHCTHARYVWNLAVEQRDWWQPGRRAPGYAEQCRQLSEARAAFPTRPAWFPQARAVRRVPDRRHRTQDVRPLNRRWAQVLVPKLRWVRFRLSRPVPDARSYRVTRDRVGRWHVAFAAIPVPIPGPSTGEVVGIDRGVTVTLALSDGHAYQAPTDRDVKRLQRRLARAKRGSNRRAKLKARHARLHARNADARRDWVEKVSTEIARGYDLIRIEDLNVAGMTRSARGRVEKVNPAYTSQRCSQCGTVDRRARESQAAFRCWSCGYSANADLNAARNIAAGHAARGGLALAEPMNREPQRVASSVK
jgi:putative transposase